MAISVTKMIERIDLALISNDHSELLKLCKIDSYQMLLSNDIELIVSVEKTLETNNLRDPNIDYNLQIKHALIISQYEKEINDFPINPCVSCECLFTRSNVTVVKMTDRLCTVVWPELKCYILQK